MLKTKDVWKFFLCSILQLFCFKTKKNLNVIQFCCTNVLCSVSNNWYCPNNEGEHDGRVIYFAVLSRSKYVLLWYQIKNVFFLGMRKELYHREIKYYHYPCCLPKQDHMVHSDVVPVPLVEQNVRYAVVCDSAEIYSRFRMWWEWSVWVG